MGSIEVYDYQQMKWVPYVPSPDNADRYYKRLRDSIEDQSSDSTMARQLRDTTDKLREAEEKLKHMDERAPEVKQVTDVAEAIERAQSELKRERKKARDTQQRKKSTVSLPKRVRNLRY